MTAPVSGATLLGVAGVLAALGYFIRFQRRLYLVAEFDPDRAAGRATMARLAGSLLLFVGGLTAVLGAVAALGRATPEVWGAYTAVVLAATAAVSVAGRVRRDPTPANGGGE